ncbi:GNAT family N-acetyltransferase [Paenibacillus sp. GCM10023250]|uniref:GNAT family N-acetyltransferase n=1 Tax=Paenibacillus sp. GCM10023250 TaxID=3252648 RepID=UPI00361A964E
MAVSFSRVNTTEDIAATAQLGARIWQEYYVSIISMEQIAYMLEKFQSVPAMTEQIERQGYEYYQIRHEGAPVGYLAVKPEAGKLFLSKLYVAKEHRGQGCASQAMAFLERLCRDRSLSAIWLTVNRHNASSIAVYEKKGFRTVREQVADIGNGYVMDDFVMEKTVAAS